MSEGWVRVPKGILTMLSPNDSGYALYLYSKSFFGEGKYSPLKYSPREMASELGVSKATFFRKISLLDSLGIAKVKGKMLYLNPSPRLNTVNSLKIETKPENSLKNETKQSQICDSTVSKMRLNSLKNETLDPLNVALRESLQASVVFLSITRVIHKYWMLDFINNFHEVRWIIEMFPKGTNIKLEQNPKFRSTLEKFLEMYPEDDSEGTSDVSRYLLLVTLDAILESKPPIGRFIYAMERVLNGESRLSTPNISKLLAGEEAKAKTKASLNSQVDATNKLIEITQALGVKADREERENNMFLASREGKYPELELEADSHASMRVLQLFPTKYSDGENVDPTRDLIYKKCRRSKLIELINEYERG